MVNRFDVHLVMLDPTIGSEVKKNRPCVIISPNSMNRPLNTVIVAPMTTRIKDYPSRKTFQFQNRQSSIMFDQIRVVDKRRLIKKLGSIDHKTAEDTLTILQKIFA